MIRIHSTCGPDLGRAKSFWGTRVLLLDSSLSSPYRVGTDFRSLQVLLSDWVSAESPGMLKFMANDTALFPRPSVLEKSEKDCIETDQIAWVSFGLMPSKHLYMILLMSWVLSLRPWGRCFIDDAATRMPRESKESFQGQIVMLVLWLGLSLKYHQTQLYSKNFQT